jgi:recombinational DNA repair protein (RecF pathway)
MHYYKGQGIILSKRHVFEKQFLISVFTKDYGVICGFSLESVEHLSLVWVCLNGKKFEVIDTLQKAILIKSYEQSQKIGRVASWLMKELPHNVPYSNLFDMTICFLQNGIDFYEYHRIFQKEIGYDVC